MQRSRSRLWGWVAAVLAGASCFGCASRGAAARLQSDMDQTDEQLRQLRGQVAAIDSLLRQQSGELRRQWVEQATESEESRRQLQQTQARLDEITRRLAAMVEGVETMRVYGGVSSAATPPAAPDAPPAAPAGGLVVDASGLYDQAFADMKNGDYALAAGEFARFLESFPRSELADNAGYWLGECHYARRDFAQAAAAFEQVAKAYPDGDKAPAVLLKLGYALPEIREKKKGVEYLQELLRRFPDSDEAGLARTRLKALGVRVPATKRR